MPRPRSAKTALLKQLDAAPVPVYMVDDRRRIIYCNAPCASFAGAEADQLIGSRCDYHSDPTSDSSMLAAMLCPPPEAFFGKVVTGIVSRDGTAVTECNALFVPLGTDEISTGGVIAFVGVNDANGSIGHLAESQEARRLHEVVRNYRLRMARNYHVDRLVGNHRDMRRARAQVEMASESRARILLSGPKGSGRETIAKIIHYHRAEDDRGALLPLDCSLLDGKLMESTIQGIVRGWSELQNEEATTLLLLDVDQLPIDAQPELLGFLCIEEFQLRTIATASEPLTELVKRGLYQADLAHLLSTLVISLPSLADRKEDIPLLAQLFVEDVNGRGDKQISGFTEGAMDQLVVYPWPGNIEELKQLVKACHGTSDGPLIRVEDLPKNFAVADDWIGHPRERDEIRGLDELLQETEVELIRTALLRSKGNKARAARLLEISRPRLLRRISQLGLEESLTMAWKK